MNWALQLVAAPLRTWIRLWRTDKTKLSAIEKFLRAILMLPAFALLLIMLRIAAALRGPLRVQAITATGDRFHCRLPDLIQLYLWLFDVWEPDLTEFIQRRLKPGDTFVDVGANIGCFSVLASRCVTSSGHVVAIEASPVVFTLLNESLTLNAHCTNVRVINKAASATSGTINIYAGPQHNIGLTTTVAARRLPAQSTIESQSLDDLLTPEVFCNARLVKIDVEGGEPDVLLGMTRFLQSGSDDVEILLELSPDWWPDQSLRPIDVLQPFLDTGFLVYDMNNNYWPWRYLWPKCIEPIRRFDGDLTKRVDRLDLVLSKRAAPEL